MKKYILEITVFLCGAIGMMLELIAARILSPYVGSSNLIWTTIIGVMLISMSIGYWIGGKLADKSPNQNTLSKLLVAGAIMSSLIPMLEVNFVEQLVNILDNLELIALISAAIVFGIPSFILATVSPYAVKLKNSDNQNIGKLSGKISSISTIGSIVGTFISGFLLIPNFGVRAIILSVTILLLLLSIVLYENKTKKYYVFISIVTVVIILLQYIGKLEFTLFNPDIIEDVDSEYSRIWVKEINTSETTYKTLYVDTGLESYIDQETGEMGAKYLKYYDLVDCFFPSSKDVLMIGGAAYTYPMHYLKTYSDKKIDVIEIDEKMTKIAEEYFNLDTSNNNLKIYHQDGRSFLNRTNNKYDAILLDAFKGSNAPFELTTYEAMKQAYKCLNSNGAIITNIISSISGEDSNFIQYEYATYKEVFDEVKMFKVHNIDENEKQNIILVGIKGKINVGDSEKYEELLKMEIKDFKTDYKIVTDNYCPIGS